MGRFWEGGLEESDTWRSNTEIERIARRFADRDISVEESLKDVDAFLDASKDKRAAAEDLVRSMQDTVNAHRNQIIRGIQRFAKRQAMMIRRIERQTQKLDDPETNSRQKSDLETRQRWDIRVFEEREGMIAYLCEQPVLLEKKFFAVGRAIAASQDKR